MAVTVLALAAAGFAAGLLNAVAGGGTLVVFPVLLSCGLPPLVANASNAVAVWPAHPLALLSAGGPVSTLGGKRRLGWLAGLGAVGGATGAGLLQFVDDSSFTKAIPLLVGTSTLVLLFGPSIRSVLGRARAGITGASCTIFIAAVYGGFFGGGLGVLLMAALLLLGVDEPHENNAAKNLIAAAVTTSGAAAFLATGLVSWPETLPVLAGAITGGICGGKLGRRLPAAGLRVAVVMLGVALTVYYAVKYY